MSAFGAEFEQLAQHVSNWKRWGAADELGTLNLLDASAVQRGVKAVGPGKCYPLALPLSEYDGIQTGAIPGRLNPARFMSQLNVPMTADPRGPCTSDDVILMGSQAGTHWDALAHVSHRGLLYNGHSAQEVTTSGANRCGLPVGRPILGRGILLDVARALGQDRLPAGYAIRNEDLDRSLAMSRTELEPGDILLIRTGHVQLARGADRHLDQYGPPSPGLSIENAIWFKTHEVAAVATDNLTFEVWPCVPAGAILPVHVLNLVYMGLLQGQNFWLEDLSEACATDGRYEFLLDATPLPFSGAVGGAVAPVAVR